MSICVDDNQVGSARRTVAPSLLPISVDVAKKQALDIIDDNSQDDDVRAAILRAVDLVERDSRRLLMPQTWTLSFDRFPCGEIEPRQLPIQSITHIKYTVGGVLTTLSTDDYESDLISEPCRIRPVNGSYWPTADTIFNAVTVTLVCGYANAAAVPETAKNAVLLATQQLFRGCSEMGMGYWTLIERLRPGGLV